MVKMARAENNIIFGFCKILFSGPGKTIAENNIGAGNLLKILMIANDILNQSLGFGGPIYSLLMLMQVRLQENKALAGFYIFSCSRTCRGFQPPERISDLVLFREDW